MAYYNLGNDRKVDIYCGNAPAWERGCSGQCESCRFCEVEDLPTGATFPYVGSDIERDFT